MLDFEKRLKQQITTADMSVIRKMEIVDLGIHIDTSSGGQIVEKALLMSVIGEM